SRSVESDDSQRFDARLFHVDLNGELRVEVFVEGELRCLVEHNPVGFVESTAIQGGLVECQQGRAVLAGQFGDSGL
ncbi:hypothetical protein LPV64_07050, partial [Ralstonia pseudosolanacearum]|nr:hypothetical protein [Ralstonia pseudosolanacearum]